MAHQTLQQCFNVVPGKITCLKHGKSCEHNGTKITKYKVKFRVEPDFGIPGAFLIKNEHKHKFFLQSATLEVPI